MLGAFFALIVHGQLLNKDGRSTTGSCFGGQRWYLRMTVNLKGNCFRKAVKSKD